MDKGLDLTDPLEVAQILHDLLKLESLLLVRKSGLIDLIGVLGHVVARTMFGQFKQAGCDPSYVIGADVEQLGGGSGAGQGQYLVAEACEFDRSFLNLQPTVAGILNVEADHLDLGSCLLGA